MPSVNPENLKWARESAGLSVDDAAHKLGFRDGRQRTAVDRLLALEEGNEEPSRAVLLKMVKQYRRPLLAFYLNSPPQKGERGEDFRTLPDAPSPAEDALVDALLRDVRARQEMVRSELEDEEPPQLTFIGSRSMNDGVRSVADDIVFRLRFDIVDFRRQRTPEDAFRILRDAVERAGIFVLLIGNLGSHHTSLESEIFRGFALADPIAPFVVVNDQDAKAAWSFTLLHEVAHLWLGATGVSGGRPVSGLERFCNEVASSILLTEEELRAVDWRVAARSFETLVAEIARFARPNNISYSMVAFRLFQSSYINQETWEQAKAHFRSMWQRQRASAREAARNDDAAGPSYYVVRRHKLGFALISFVRQQIEDGDLSVSKAAKILGVKPRSVPVLLSGGGFEPASAR